MMLWMLSRRLAVPAVVFCMGWTAFALCQPRGFEVYTSSDGLTSDRVNCALVVSPDCIWFGTDCGADRLTPSGITSFRIGDTESWGVRGAPVLDLALDARGRLWAAVSGGGPRFFVDDRLGFAGSLGGDELLLKSFCVLGARNGDLWVGASWWIGRYSFEDRLWRFFNGFSVRTLGDDAYALAEEGGGTVWVATYHQVCRAEDRGERWSYYSPVRHSHFRDVAVLADGRKMVVGWQDSPGPGEDRAFILATNDGSRWTRITPEISPPFGEWARFRCVTADPDGGVWIGTRQGALFWSGVDWRWVWAWYSPEGAPLTGQTGEADITDIAVGADGQVAFASAGCGVGVLRSGLSGRPIAWLQLGGSLGSDVAAWRLEASGAFEMDSRLDLYVAVVRPNGSALFAPGFGSDVSPFFSNVLVRAGRWFEGLELLELEAGALGPGRYTWFAACTYAGTMDLASNIASCEWQFEE